jgi:hypothetical protein
MNELSKRRLQGYCFLCTFTKSARKDHRGVDLISYALPFGRLWYAELDAVGNAVSC